LVHHSRSCLINKGMRVMKKLLLSLVAALSIFQSSARADEIITSLGQISTIFQSTGDMMTRGATSRLQRIPIGTTGQVLTVSSAGLPAWSSASSFSDITLSGDLIFTKAAAEIVPGATSIAFRNNADSKDNLRILDAGTVETFSTLTILSGNLVLNAAASKIIPGATSLSHRNNGDSADNLLITDAGVVTARAGLATTTGGVTVTAGNVVFGDTNSGILTNSADATDNKRIIISGGGGTGNTRGAELIVSGNELNNGAASLLTGGGSGSLTLGTSSGAGVTNIVSNTFTRWTFGATGQLTNNATNGGDIIFDKSGTTVSVQEATGASACMGIATPNGVTNVTVTTTCAVANSHAFFTRKGAITNMGVISVTTNPAGASFTFASTNAADTLASSVIWWIIKES
jgi:hypothetical protein